MGEILQTLAKTHVSPGVKRQTAEFVGSSGALVPDSLDWKEKGYASSVRHLYVINNGGIDSEASYPYEGVQGQCRYNSAGRAANCTKYYFVSEGDEEALKEAVANIGPIAVAIDATHPKFVLYHSGVYNDPSCLQKINHRALVVGYGSVAGQDYWLVKNNWGTGFGDGGYIRMARNQNNMCGIALYPCYPVM